MIQKCIRKIVSFVCLLTILAAPFTLQAEAIATTEVDSYYQTGRAYMIQNVHSGKFLEVANGNLTSGGNVWQDTFNYESSLSQVFFLFSVTIPNQSSANEREYFQIVPVGNQDLYLDLEDAYDANGSNIQVFEENTADRAQYFALLKNNDGSFCIEPYLCYGSERVLTVSNDSTSNQANVQLGNKDSNNPSQRWVFKEIEPVYDPEYINQNWGYFFHGDAGSTYRRISQRMNLSSSNWHNGTDIPADVDTAIYSPFEGEVIAMRRVTPGQNEGSMGNYVIIRSDDDIYTARGQKQVTVRMMHMNSIPAEIAVGVSVGTNDIIGRVGNTGNSNGNHLHIDINIEGYRNGEDLLTDPDSLINPERFFLSKRFRYGSSSVRIYATDVVY